MTPGHQAMNILVADLPFARAWHKLLDMTGKGIQLVQPRILGADPDVAGRILADIMYEIAAKAVGPIVGKILPEPVRLLRIIIDPAKESAHPGTTFPVPAKGVNHIIGDRIGIAIFLLHPRRDALVQIVNINTGFGTQPPARSALPDDLVQLDHTGDAGAGKYIPDGAGPRIEQKHLVHRAQQYQAVIERVNILDGRERLLRSSGREGILDKLFSPRIIPLERSPAVGCPAIALFRYIEHQFLGIPAIIFLNTLAERIVPVQMKIADDPNLLVFVGLDIPHLARGQRIEKRKPVTLRIIPVNAFVSAHPQLFLGIFVKAKHRIAADAGSILRIVLEDPETVAIETVQPIARTKPHEPFTILQNTGDRIARHPIAGLVIPEIIGLPMDKSLHKKEQEKKHRDTYSKRGEHAVVDQM